MTRITAFVFVAPIFSQRGVPTQYKVALSLFISGFMYGVLGEHTPLEYQTVLGYAVIIIREAMTGLIVGFAASICNTVVDFAGRIIDMEVGVSMANLMDPTTNQSSGVSSVIYQYGIMLMLLLTGLHRYFIQALAETFRLIPINGAIFDSDRLLESMIRFMGDYITIGFRICLPVFAVMLLLNAVLGIMTKVAPQMNMFSVGMQLKVLVGLCVLFLTIGMLPDVSNFIFSEMKVMITLFVEAVT